MIVSRFLFFITVVTALSLINATEEKISFKKQIPFINKLGLRSNEKHITSDELRMLQSAIIKNKSRTTLMLGKNDEIIGVLPSPLSSEEQRALAQEEILRATKVPLYRKVLTPKDVLKPCHDYFNDDTHFEIKNSNEISSEEFEYDPTTLLREDLSIFEDN